MPIPATVGALLVVLALVPGWLYLRLLERLRPPSAYSGLQQFLEVLTVGVATTGVAVIIVLLVPHWLLPFTIDVDAWGLGGNAYLRAHAHETVWSLALIFIFALLIALGLYGIRAWRTPVEFSGQGNVWVHSLGARPTGKVPWVALHLDDGRLIEGQLHAFALEDDPAKRDVALAHPLRVTAKDETVANWLPHLDRVIVSASRIAFVTVIHVPAIAQKQWTRRWWLPLWPRRLWRWLLRRSWVVWLRQRGQQLWRWFLRRSWVERVRQRWQRMRGKPSDESAPPDEGGTRGMTP